jgi:hypothetical protein
VQQGGNAQERQQIKQQSAEHTQTVAAQEEMARAAESNARVQGAEESKRAHMKRDKPKEKRDDQSSGETKKKKNKKEQKPKASTGKLLDTVA